MRGKHGTTAEQSLPSITPGEFTTQDKEMFSTHWIYGANARGTVTFTTFKPFNTALLANMNSLRHLRGLLHLVLEPFRFYPTFKIAGLQEDVLVHSLCSVENSSTDIEETTCQ